MGPGTDDFGRPGLRCPVRGTGLGLQRGRDYACEGGAARKGLLALVAKLGQHQHGWVTAREIYERLAKYKVPEEKTASLLSQFTRTYILEEGTVDERLRYRLAVPLVQERFVRQNLHFKGYFRYT